MLRGFFREGGVIVQFQNVLSQSICRYNYKFKMIAIFSDDLTKLQDGNYQGVQDGDYHEAQDGDYQAQRP